MHTECSTSCSQSVGVLAAVLLVASSRAGAQCPEWGPGFGSPGTSATVIASVVWDDGSGPALFVGGTFTGAGGSPARHVAKWNGSTWSALGSGTDAPVDALAVFDDGGGPALYAGGRFTSAGGIPASRVAKWNGVQWSALGSGTTATVRALAVHGGELVAAGQFVQAGGSSASRIARWNGAQWSPLGSGTDGILRALAVYDDGSGPALFVGGEFQTAGGAPASNLALWDGASWSPVGGGTDGNVTSLTVFDDGAGPHLAAGGAFTVAGGVSAGKIAAWDGSAWSALGAGVDGSVLALLSFDAGAGRRLVAGGNFLQAGGSFARRIASWDGTIWQPLELPSGPGDRVRTLAAIGATLFVGGEFEAIEHTQTELSLDSNHIARWSTGRWSGLSRGLDGEAWALVGFDDGAGPALYAGGRMRSAGDVPLYGIGRWNGVRWSDVGGGTNGFVHDLVVHDDGHGRAVFATGDFTIAGGVQANHVARWTGSSWSPLGAGLPAVPMSGMAVMDDGSGPRLYVAGGFGPPHTASVVCWDGLGWSTVGTFSPGWKLGLRIQSLAAHDDGSGPALYAAGSFYSASPGTGDNVARLRNGLWSDVGLLSPSGVDLIRHDDGTGSKLYVDGPRRWNGSFWETAGGTWFLAYGSAVFDDGSGSGPSLYVGGSFTSIAGVDAQRVARWDGNAWSAISTPGIGGGTGPYSAVVSEFAVTDDGTGPSLWVGGRFATAGGWASSYLAQWRGCPTIGEPLCTSASQACPCASSASTPSGCANSVSTAGASLTAGGLASLTQPSLRLTATGMPSAAVTLFVQSASALDGAGVAFGDGLRCAAGHLVRLGVRTAQGGAAELPSAGGAPLPTLGGIRLSGNRVYEAWYRDAAAFCTPASFNATNALRLAWIL